MKHAILKLSVLAMIVTTTASCSTTMLERAGGGFQQILTSPFQVSENIRAETPKAKFKPIGAVGGTVKGGVYMGQQIVSGILTVLTFFNTK
jgi:hypothetical protein